MAAGFKKFIERCRTLDVNKAIAEKYVLFLKEKEKPKEETRLSYCTIVLIFLETINKELEALLIKDIKDYKLKKKNVLSDNRLNDVISRIADFFDFCKNEGVLVKISKNDILNLKIPTNVIQETNSPRIISPDEIVKIRQVLIKKEDVRKLLTIELLYGFGLRQKDLGYFSFDNYNERKGNFIYKGRNIYLPEYLRILISGASNKNLDKYSTYGGNDVKGFRHHIIATSELSNIKLKISDLTETHKKTSIGCPECGKNYPFEEQYWMLQEKGSEGIRFYFPICMCCVKEIGQYE